MPCMHMKALADTGPYWQSFISRLMTVLGKVGRQPPTDPIKVTTNSLRVQVYLLFVR